MRTTRLCAVLAALCATGLAAPTVVTVATAADEAAVAPSDVTLTVVTIEYEGTKIWVPGPIVVQKGNTVTLKLINNVPSEPTEHGFAIPAFGVSAVVTAGTPETVTFTADREGIFPLFCQLHPAHVGGQLVVLP